MFRKLTFAQVRDVLLLLCGLALLGHETLVAAEPRWILIGIAGGMIGLPATFLADRRFVSSTPAGQPAPEPTPTPEVPPAGPEQQGPAA
jgi:hypothetical protein